MPIIKPTAAMMAEAAKHDYYVKRIGNHLLDPVRDCCINCNAPRYGLVEFHELQAVCSAETLEAIQRPRDYRRARDAALAKIMKSKERGQL